MLASDDDYPYTAYFLCDGNPGTASGTSPDTLVPDGCTRIEKDEYDTRLAQILAEQEAAAEAQRQADLARQKADYDALKALGLPEEMCRRLSGYTGP